VAEHWQFILFGVGFLALVVWLNVRDARIRRGMTKQEIEELEEYIKEESRI
jgi:hypothetical protein